MVTFVQGDMFEGTYDILVNTVNCVGVMGTGVALAFKKRFPEMFRSYKIACDEGRVRPGQLEVWQTLTECIVNFPTKRHWKAKSRYEDVDAGLTALREYLASLGPVRVALPALGCGHGGLDWTRVASMIESRLKDLEAEVHVYEPQDSVQAGIGAQAKAAPDLDKSSINWVTLDTQSNCPIDLKESGIRQMTFWGNENLLRTKSVWLRCGPRPDRREDDSAIACAVELGKAGVTLSLELGARLTLKAALASLEQGGDIVLWSPQGSARVQVPSVLHSAVKCGRVTIVTVSDAEQDRTAESVARLAFVQSRMARAILLASDSWQTWLETQTPHCPVYFIWYGESRAYLQRLTELGARPIGKSRETGVPNIAPLVDRLHSGDTSPRCTTAAGATEALTGQPVANEQGSRELVILGPVSF